MILILFYVSPVLAAPPVYINLKSHFKSFVEKAHNADFDTQLKIWQVEVESALPQIYSELLSQLPDKTIEQNRREKAQKWFPFMFAHADKILAQFDNFTQAGWPMAQRLAARYPQVDFSNVKVISMPSLMMFNGQVRIIKGQTVAMFGMDFLQLVDENPKLIEGADLINDASILVAHEFTHVLYHRIVKFDESEYSAYGLFGPLWNEGLAQMHSQMLVPGADLTTVLMERNLAAKCTRTQVAQWAAMYLEDSKVTSEDELMSYYGKWFLMNNWKALGVPRAGYCLGYHTVLVAMREQSFNELLSLKPDEAYAVIKKALTEMADTQQYRRELNH